MNVGLSSRMWEAILRLAARYFRATEVLPTFKCNIFDPGTFHKNVGPF